MKLTDHLEKLNYFYEVARLGSLKKASESVYISQPSLTKSIKILEDVVGVPLFTRLPRGMKLTKEGEILKEHCQKLFASISDMEQELTYPDDPLAGSLRIGTYDSIGIYFWPKFLQGFLTQHKNLDIDLRTGRSSEMQNALETGLIDLAVIVNPVESLNTHVDILKKDSFKLYETTSKRKVYQDKKNAPLIAMPTATTGIQSIKDILHKSGLGERKVYVTSSLESVKELTLNGIGIGLLPQMVAKSSLEHKKLNEIKLKGFPTKGIGEHTIGIIHHNFRRDSHLIKEIVKAIKDYSF